MTIESAGAAPSSPPLARVSGCPIHRLLGGGPEAGEQSSLPVRLAMFSYGLVAYGAFLGTILYAIGFVGNFVVPKSIDSGVAGDVTWSLVVNTLLLSVFVVQHTVMARPAFKKWWTRVVPEAVERSTFVLAASGALALVFWGWRPLPTVIWAAEGAWLRWTLTGLSLAGWALVFASSYMVSHWDLFGLRQVFARLVGRTYEPIGFRIAGMYKLVRHPLMTGFLLAVWFTPVMTVGHLFFAGMITAYILLGTTLEERDLVAQFGDTYREYRRQVPGLIPLPGRRIR